MGLHDPGRPLKPLLRYPGGKFYALKYLRPFYNAVKHDEYREPFAGGATVFFDKQRVAHNWLNDVDTELMTLYRQLAAPDSRDQLVARLSKEEARPERWKRVYESATHNDLDVAHKYYYLNRTSFSGKLSSPSWGYRPKRSVPPERWEERLAPSGAKLEGVTLTTGDFQPVVEAPAKGRSTLLFVDPPYFAPPKNKHYRNGFDHEDHVRLAKCLRKTRHKFILTYDDVTEVRDLYDWATVCDLKFTYRVDNSVTQDGRRRTGCELVITNFTSQTKENLLELPPITA